jgi:hypothetical protein
VDSAETQNIPAAESHLHFKIRTTEFPYGGKGPCRRESEHSIFHTEWAMMMEAAVGSPHPTLVGELPTHFADA